MHPPPFRLQHRLSDWPGCTLELTCGRGVTVYPLRLMIRDHGDRTFAEILPRLRCEKCGRRPAPVYLVAGHHRKHSFGPPPDWALELVPVPRGAT